MSFAYSPINLDGSSGGTSGGGAGRITVGSGNAGANFSSIAAAMAASHNSFSIISNLSAATPINVPASGLQISIDKGATLNIGSGYFNVGGNELQIDGNGILTYSSSPFPLFDGTTGASLIVKDIGLFNSSSIERCLTDIDFARFSSVLSSGDYRICGNSSLHHGGIYRDGGVQVPSTVSNTLIASSIFRSMRAIADSGVNTVVDGALVY